MIEVYGTIGPTCADLKTLTAMFRAGMTGIRLNLSHAGVQASAAGISLVHEAAAACGMQPKLLLDLQGPELRIGKLPRALHLWENDTVLLGEGGIPLPVVLLKKMAEFRPGTEFLLDDGIILLRTTDRPNIARVIRGGILTSGKSIAVVDENIVVPTLTEQDKKDIACAPGCGVTGVMLPFTRYASNLAEVRAALDEAGGQNIKLMAKIENMDGVNNLESFFPYADEIVIARGDLGNAMNLWELPRVQKDIAARCRAAGKPFMVVTQMLSSMEKCAVPTRAEVCDIYNAVCDGASSVMVTGETATGSYPVQVIEYLAKTAAEAEANR